MARQCAPFLTLPPDHPLARRVTQLFAQEQMPALANRLAFAQTFAELVGPQLSEAMNKGRENDKNQQEAKRRLRQLISQTPESELSEFVPGGIGQAIALLRTPRQPAVSGGMGNRLPRPMSRIFGSRRRANCCCKANLKIIDVALESGHGSLAHFNYAFKKRFHMTPTEWRERQMPRAVAARLRGPGRCKLRRRWFGCC